MNWNAELVRRLGKAPRPVEEIARYLLVEIQKIRTGHEDRPIVFIGSCLGGIFLMQALAMADGEYVVIQRATRGIIFLSTPFTNTAFRDVTLWAEPGLKEWSSVDTQAVTQVLEKIRQSTELEDLVRSFTVLNKSHYYDVYSFCEGSNPDILLPPGLRCDSKVVGLPIFLGSGSANTSSWWTAPRLLSKTFHNRCHLVDIMS